MNLPKLNEIKQSRSFIDTFQGINEGEVIGEGEFSSMKNLTSDFYPAMAVRKKRSIYEYIPKGQEIESELEEEKEIILGMISKEKLFVITGWGVKQPDSVEKYVSVFYGGEAIDCKSENAMGLSYSKKQLVSMGAYICIFPDKVWFNTATKEFGPMESYFDMETAKKEANLEYSPMMVIKGCTEDGGSISATVADTEPENPGDGSRWVDTSGDTAKLRRFDETSGMWISEDVFIRLEWAGIDNYFEVGDIVEIKGFDGGHLESFPVKSEIINGFHKITGSGENYLILAAEEAIWGITWSIETQNMNVSISRAVPDMDFVTESNNRIWGCKYGEVNGEFINEIYACKQGDMKSWYAYEGISTDSYAMSVGSDGPFTGAVTYLGYPTFFKENQILKIYGSMPSEFQLSATECHGVEKGSEKSLCVINGVLYYKSLQDICAYDGSMPYSISEKLRYGYKNGIAGRFDQKYFISMEKDGFRHMLVYDTKKGLWHEEDGLEVEEMISYEGDLLLHQGGTLWSVRGSTGEKEKNFEWEATTGVIGYSYPDKKYISRFGIRAQMEPDSLARIYLEYDSSGRFEYAGEVKGTRPGTVVLPVRPRRCDHMRMRIAGKGNCKIYSIAKILEIGSDM